MGDERKTYFETILPTVQENSKTVRNTYISYLAVAAYIWLTIESITHRHLLIPDERLALPVIGLKLPVVGFFWIAPLFLLLFHIYFIIHLVNFAALLTEIKTQLKGFKDDWKSQIHGSLFTWYFLKPESTSRPGSMLISPLILLSFWLLTPVILLRIQWVFLPYHHHVMTPYHQYLVAIGAGISAFFLWKTYAYKNGIAHNHWLVDLRKILLMPMTMPDRQNWKNNMTALKGSATLYKQIMTFLNSILLASIFLFIAYFSNTVLLYLKPKTSALKLLVGYPSKKPR